MNKKTALITGITGQDGSYLAEFLLKNPQFRGIIRRVQSLEQYPFAEVKDNILSKKNIKNIKKINNQVKWKSNANTGHQSNSCVGLR